jgi:hypothetical protein
MAFNSNSFSYDLPFGGKRKSRPGRIAPASFGDGRIYTHRDSGNPVDALVV